MSQESQFEADVCIVGGGPAGIAVARELIGADLQVLLLESGGLGFDVVAQDANRGAVVSPEFTSAALSNGRHRQFGGTANLWLYRTIPDDGRRYARSLPPEALDLERTNGAETSGWPVDAAALTPYLARAQHVWNGAAYDYEAATWATGAESPLRDGETDLVTRVSQHGPGDVFTFRYRDELIQAPNITVLPRTTALDFTTSRDGASVTGVDAVDGEGSPTAIRARAVVLCGGGVENARLLLASRIGSPGGPANQHDNVGRYLTDHPEFTMGAIDLDATIDATRFADYDLRWVGPTLVSNFVTLREDVKRAEGLLNVSGALVAHGHGYGSATHRAIASILAGRAQHGVRSLVRDLLTVGRHPDHLIALMRSRREGPAFREFSGGWSTSGRRLSTLEVHGASEQTPDRENRISLSREPDHYGRPRAELHWSWSADDRRNVARSVELIGRAFAEARIGQFRAWTRLDSGASVRFDGLHHPMGSTRIDADPRLGVVDANLQVHGVEHLFVAGSSIFPTGHGYANPTLSVLAFAIRLGDHLRATLPRRT